MEYQKVIDLITPDFLKFCCDNSFDYEAGLSCHSRLYICFKGESICLLDYIPTMIKLGRFCEIPMYKFLHFQSLLHQAMDGLNRKIKDTFIFIDYTYVPSFCVNEMVFSACYFPAEILDRTITPFLCNDFESDQLLRPELQVLICALKTVMEWSKRSSNA